MSFESDSYLPPRPNLVRSVREWLEILGYRRVEPSEFKWRPNALATLLLYSEKDYESLSGVYLLLYRDERPGVCVYARTNSWCSRWDLDQQIRTIRLLKRYFGGSFITDAGANRYWRNEQPAMAPAEAGCSLAFERFHQSIDRVVHYLDEREFGTTWSDPKRVKAADVMNPRLFSNNLLLPFLVSAMEHYFKSAFIAVARYSENRETHFKNARIPPERMARVASGEASVEEVLVEGMSFQNLGAVCGYFRTLDRRIDLAGVLRRPVGRRRFPLHDAVERIVSRRHELIHRNALDLSFEDLDAARAIDDLYAAVRKCHEQLIAVHGWSIEALPPRSWTAKRRLRVKAERKPGTTG